MSGTVWINITPRTPDLAEMPLLDMFAFQLLVLPLMPNPGVLVYIAPQCQAHQRFHHAVISSSINASRFLALGVVVNGPVATFGILLPRRWFGVIGSGHVGSDPDTIPMGLLLTIVAAS